MLQRRSFPLAAGAGLFLFLIGVPWLVIQSGDLLRERISPNQSQKQTRFDNPKSNVLSLVSLSPAQRALQLQALAQLPPSIDSSRAHYLLASDRK